MDLKPEASSLRENTFAKVTNRSQLLGELAGAASVCWEGVRNAGVFLPNEAGLYVDDALNRLEELEPLHHDGETLQKVWKALSRAGCSSGQAQDAVIHMQNAGIYFPGDE